MGKWAKIQLSGSNLHARELYASNILAGGPGTPAQKDNVVIWDTSDNRFKLTGSYGDAGRYYTNDTYPWFPYEGDLGLTVASGQSTARVLTLGKDRNAAGFARFSFDVGSTTRVGSQGQSFQITRNAGQNTNSQFRHHGYGDVIIDHKHNTGLQPNTVNKARPYAQIPNPAWVNPGNLVGGNTGLASVNTTGNAVSSIFLYIGVVDIDNNLTGTQDFGEINERNTLTGISVKLRMAKGNAAESDIVVKARLIANGGAFATSFSTVTVNSTALTEYVVGGEQNVLGFPQLAGGVTFGTPGGPEPYTEDFFRVADTLQGDPNQDQYVIIHLYVESGASSNNVLFLQGSDTDSTLSPSLFYHQYDSINDDAFSVKAPALAGGGTPFACPQDGQIRIGFPDQGGFFFLRMLGGVYSDSQTGPKLIYAGGSTKKIKTNITPLPDSILQSFDQLKPITFKYIESPKVLEGGFIAEDVAECHPLFARWLPNYRVGNGKLYLNAPPIDDKLVPLDISERGIMAAAVKKLQHLENELNQLNG